jgi:putative sugar O-methyltransferase
MERSINQVDGREEIFTSVVPGLMFVALWPTRAGSEWTSSIRSYALRTKYYGSNLRHWRGVNLALMNGIANGVGLLCNGVDYEPSAEVIMQEPIPNQELLRYLLKSYYGMSGAGSNGGDVSSHWKYYSDLFDVQVTPTGELVSLSGIGFGMGKWAHLPHRILDQAAILTHLLHLTHRWRLLRLMGKAAKICRSMGLDLTLDVFRQVCSLELLDRHMPNTMRQRNLTFLMIGDGYGVLAALLKAVFPTSTIVLVDIGKTLLFQAYYCQKAYPEAFHSSVEGLASLEGVDFAYCPAEQLSSLRNFSFDVAVNIVSMQEMDLSTVNRYFHFLRGHMQDENLFYCCNRESKTLFAGEVIEFAKYGWRDGDQYLVDDSSPWNLYFFLWGRANNGPSIFGIRIPFASFYDGRVLHRMARLAID